MRVAVIYWKPTRISTDHMLEVVDENGRREGCGKLGKANRP